MNRLLRIGLRGWRKLLNIGTFGHFPYSDDNTVPSYWCISHAKVNEWGLAQTNLTPHIAAWEISYTNLSVPIAVWSINHVNLATLPIATWEINHTNLSEPIAAWAINAEKVSYWSLHIETKDC